MLNKSGESEAAFWGAWLLLVATFVALAYWATQEYYLPGDRAITFGVQDLYTQPRADDVFTAASRLGDEWVVGLALGLTIGVLGVRRRYAEAMIVAAATLSIFVVVAIDAYVKRPTAEYDAMRAVFDGLFHPRIYPDPGGFPSGHVYGTVLAYGIVFWLAARTLRWDWLVACVRLFCVAAIVLGFIAPMYLGTHWFSDVYGAALLAGIVIMLAWRADAFVTRNEEPTYVRDLVGYRTPRTAAEARAQPTTTRFRS